MTSTHVHLAALAARIEQYPGAEIIAATACVNGNLGVVLWRRGPADQSDPAAPYAVNSWGYTAGGALPGVDAWLEHGSYDLDLREGWERFAQRAARAVIVTDIPTDPREGFAVVTRPAWCGPQTTVHSVHADPVDAHRAIDPGDNRMVIPVVIGGQYGCEPGHRLLVATLPEPIAPPSDLELSGLEYTDDYDDDADWRRELAQEAGMGLGVAAYNDALGQSLDEPCDDGRS